MDLDDEDDLPSNGIVSPPLVEGREQLGAHLTNSKPSSAGELKLVKTQIQQEVKSPSGFASSELKGSSMGELSNGITTPTLEEATVAAPSAPLPTSVAVFDKPKQTNDPPAVFSFSSKVADKFPSLMPESSSRTPETKPESSSRLVIECKFISYNLLCLTVHILGSLLTIHVIQFLLFGIHLLSFLW